MPKRIVVIVDGSETSNYAVDASITLALDLQSTLTFCVTVDPDLFGDGVGVLSLAEMAMGNCQNLLQHAIERAKNRGFHSAVGRILREDPVPAVVRVAKEENSDFIMMGLAPRVGILRPFMRSLAEEVLRESDIPLCAMRRPARGQLYRRILVPLVCDETAPVALEHALTLATELRSALVFCTVDSYDQDKSRRAVANAHAAARARGIESEEFVLPSENGVPNTITHLARIKECDSIVMASHMRTGWPRLIEGSITAAVIYAGDTPVIFVRKPLAAA